MTNQITDTKLLENQILGNQIAGTPSNATFNLGTAQIITRYVNLGVNCEESI